MLMFGMRLGADPRTVVTTTPRPAKLIRDLVRDPICVVTRGSSHENRGNLAPVDGKKIMRSNNGHRLERNRKSVDSPLEGTGFELSVPREAAGTLLSQYQSAACCSVLVDCMA